MDKSKYLSDCYSMYVGGKWIEAADGGTFDVINPSNKEVLCICSEATEEDVDMAVKSAQEAFKSFKKSSIDERSSMLNKIADCIQDNAERLAMVECLDTGKLYSYAYANIMFSANFYRYCAGALMAYEGKATMISDTTMSIILREPIGVVGQIIPWNVPYIIVAWKLGPALAMGCTTVIKPSVHASLGTLEFVKCIEEILPPGVINVVTGSGEHCGQYLMEHKGLNKLSFTGSTEIGRMVGHAAAEKIIPCTLELGGKSVDIVFPDSDREKVRSGIKTYLVNAAQVCSAGSRLLIHEDIYDEIVDMAKEIFEGVKVGLPWQDDSQMGALCYEKHFNNVLDYLKAGTDEGAQLVCGGKRLTEGGLDKGLFMAPALLADVTNDMVVAREEIFGPILVAIKFKDEEDALRIANDSTYGLSGAVYTNDINKALRVARGVETGRMWINSYGDIKTTGVIFGGYKQSGIGREGHWLSFDYYTQIKSIVVNLA